MHLRRQLLLVPKDEHLPGEGEARREGKIRRLEDDGQDRHGASHMYEIHITSGVTVWEGMTKSMPCVEVCGASCKDARTEGAGKILAFRETSTP